MQCSYLFNWLFISMNVYMWISFILFLLKYALGHLHLGVLSFGYSFNNSENSTFMLSVVFYFSNFANEYYHVICIIHHVIPNDNMVCIVLLIIRMKLFSSSSISLCNFTHTYIYFRWLGPHCLIYYGIYVSAVFKVPPVTTGIWGVMLMIQKQKRHLFLARRIPVITLIYLNGLRFERAMLQVNLSF